MSTMSTMSTIDDSHCSVNEQVLPVLNVEAKIPKAINEKGAKYQISVASCQLKLET